jgi:hypothetical protein
MIAITSCQKTTSPRTLYLSGSMPYRSDTSKSHWELRLGFYIEISDTSETKMYSKNAGYCIITLPDSLKNRILDLALRNSFSDKKNRLYISDERYYVTYFDEYIYNMRIIQDTLDRTITFKRYLIQEPLRQLSYMIEDIVRHPVIKDTIKFDLTKYRDQTLQTILQEDTTFNIPPIR